MRLRLLLVLCLAACSAPATVTPDGPGSTGDGGTDADTPDHVADVVSGSRLRAKYWASAEDPVHARTFVGWHDAQLDIDCTWSTGDAPRCLPDHALTDVYLDAACTTPVFEQYQSFHYARIVAGATCGHDGEMYVVGDAITPATVYDSDGAGGCAARVAAGQYFQLALDTAPYVTGTIAEVGTHRTHAREVQGADGSIWPFGARDTVLNTDCNPVSIGADVACLPRHIPSMFAEDSSCAQPVGFYSSSCPAPSFLFLSGPDPKLYHRGEVAQTGPGTFNGFTRAGATCSPYTRTLTASTVVMRGVDEVSLDSLPQATREETPAGRLTSKRLVVDAFAQPDGFHDNQLGQDCLVEQTSPGAYRCVPPTGTVTRDLFWTDATCTTRHPVVLTYGLQPTVARESLTASTLFFTIGAAIDPATLFVGSPGSCAAFQPDGSAPFEIGAALGADTFATFSALTE